MKSAIPSLTSAEVESLPPWSLDKFMHETGLCPSTCWRFRKRGWLKVENIAGRNYITRAAILEFNQRMARGEFAKDRKNPRDNKSKK